MASKAKNKRVKAKASAKAAKDQKAQAKADSKAQAQIASGPQRRRSPEDQRYNESILDERSRRDIEGIVFVVLAIVMLLLAVLPSDALVSGFASLCVHRLFGIGCYVLPLVLLAIAFAFFWKFNGRHNPVRTSLGLAVIFIGMLAVFALFAPISVLGEDEPGMLFSESALEGYGGYIGSAIAWAGLALFGRVITAVVLAGVIVIGCVIVGFSLSSAIERMRSSASRLGEMASVRHRQSSSTGGFARVRQQPGQGGCNSYDDNAMAFLEAESAREGFDPNNTVAFGGIPQQAQQAMNTGLPLIDAGYNAVPADIAPAAAHPSPESMAQPAQRTSRRLNIPDDVDGDSLTRRLAPLPLEGSEVNGVAVPSTGGFVPIVHDGIVSSTPEDGLVDYGCDVADDAWPDLADMHDYQHETPIAYDEASWDEPDDDILPWDEPDVPSKPAAAKRTSNPRAAKAAAAAIGSTATARTSSKGEVSQDAPEGSFKLPPMSLLNKPGRRGRDSRSGFEATANALQTVLSDFRIDARVVEWIAGPTVTLFEVDLPAGVRVSRIISLSNDIALALASPGVRIFAPVPGTNYVGIEVPNAKRETVFLSEVLADAPAGPLQIAIGKDVEGNSIVSDLAKMPHLLIGGTTGSGKSVSINGMIMSILMRATPDEVRFIMIDPKRVEFTPYNGIPHLYVPVVTEPAEAANALAWGVAEMERRLKIFSKPEVAVKNISQYNAKVAAQQAEIKAAEAQGTAGELDDQAQESEEILEHLPYIVIIIDELADLMMNIGKEVEISISRLAQLARAAGIHLIVATQRPSTNVVTGLIKANITNRIAFNVASSIDSRVILDAAGAESLIGLGDLLLSKPELARPQRIQGCFVTEDEINKVVDFVKGQGEPDYHNDILSTNVITLGASSPSGGDSSGSRDPYIWEAADIVVSSGMGSTSNLQRRLKVGYARAGRIMDQLEEIGVVGPANGSKPRDVLLDEMELESVKAFEMAD